MKKLPCAFICFLIAVSSLAQPATDIYLFDLSVKKSKASVSHPENITKHKGYDNQPFFHPDKPLIYYSSADESGKTNILSYDYKLKATKTVVETPEREYSPTVTLDKQFISCIIQRDNGAQDLGKYPIDGGEPFIIIDNMKVGYHVWADNSHLGLFILGQDNAPHTLHYLLLPIKKDTIISENIGRSLHKVPNESAISFVRKITDTNWVIKKLNTKTMTVTDVAPAITAHEDLAWHPDGRIFMSDGVKIFFNIPSEGPGWNEVTVSGGLTLKEITRLAISADGKKLAVVANE